MESADGHSSAVRSLARLSGARGLRLAIALILALALLALAPLAESRATVPQRAEFHAAQVRFFREDGRYLGGGTLVGRNWAVTVGHLFANANDPTRYSLRFGVLNDQNDSNDRSNIRQVDRIVSSSGGVAMVHFADPVPENTWIPRVATEAPQRNNVTLHYGWSRRGDVLSRTPALVIDPIASQNAAAMRPLNSYYARLFPTGIDPMILNIPGRVGDSGGGLFTLSDTLLGIQEGEGEYQYVNDEGHLYGPVYDALHEQPLWRYASWIQDVMNGAGSSNQAPDPHDGELRRRRLNDGTSSPLPITSPPDIDVCDVGVRCNLPKPAWTQATLTLSSATAGTVAVDCAQAAENDCSFDGTSYRPGESSRLQLRQAGCTGAACASREVMIWCRTTGSINGEPARRLLRFSFTNADHREVPIGKGWWDVNPERLTTAQGPANTASFASC